MYEFGPSGVHPRILVVGGDDRVHRLEADVVGLRAFPSSRFAGPLSIRRAVATIAPTDLVVVLCRWLGHSDSAAITARCRAVGAKILTVHGGFSAALAAIRNALEAR